MEVQCSVCGEYFEYEISEEVLDEFYGNDLEKFKEEHTFVCGECDS